MTGPQNRPAIEALKTELAAIDTRRSVAAGNVVRAWADHAGLTAFRYGAKALLPPEPARNLAALITDEVNAAWVGADADWERAEREDEDHISARPLAGEAAWHIVRAKLSFATSGWLGTRWRSFAQLPRATQEQLSAGIDEILRIERRERAEVEARASDLMMPFASPHGDHPLASQVQGASARQHPRDDLMASFRDGFVYFGRCGAAGDPMAVRVSEDARFSEEPDLLIGFLGHRAEALGEREAMDIVERLRQAARDTADADGITEVLALRAAYRLTMRRIESAEFLDPR